MPYINHIRQRGLTRWYLGAYHSDIGVRYEIHFSKSYNAEDDSEIRNLIFALTEVGEINQDYPEWSEIEEAIQTLPLK